MNEAGKWIILLVAFDDAELEPQVLKERIAADEDEQLAALLRGAELIAVLDEDEEETAEGFRREFEKQCLR
ncbi:MAG TPA: hypothetical protein VF669_20545 [Tepidisphaeraceae bacterium]|jgi:hypothetical protein